MNFTIELVTAAAGLLASGVALYQAINHRSGDLRESYRFAKEFLRDCSASEPPLHDYAKHRGYQALCQDTDVDPVIVEYILGLKHPATRLRDYVMGRRFVQAHRAQQPDMRIEFRPGYEQAVYRRLAQVAYLAGYALFGALAIAPAMLTSMLQFDWRTQLVLLGMSVPAFGYLAWSCLVEYAGLYRATQLVRSQTPRESRVLPV
jgi:hypothetical protein